MIDKVQKAIEYYGLFDDVSYVTVALSGGADSMALLYVMNELKDRYGFKLSAAHFNHKIRGDESDSDENFAREACNKLGVEFFCKSADIPKIAKENGESLELAARKARYDFLSSVSKGVVATAHTASDNVETVIFNLSRGTAIKGLCGIPAKRDGIIRPLLFCTRNDIEEYCNKNNISYVIDSTNLLDDYSRNNIRHNVIPVLKNINSSLERSVVHTSISLSEDADYLEKISDDEFVKRFKDARLDITGFSKLHVAIAKRVIVKFLKFYGQEDIDSHHINSVYDICLVGGKCSMGNCMSAVAKNGKLVLLDNDFFVKPQHKYNVSISEHIFDKNRKINELFLNNSLDCDKIKGQLVLRVRSDGDTVKLRKTDCTKTLKKIYNEKRIELSERSVLPVISDDEGVVWICGIGVAKRCAVDDKTKRIFSIKCVIE